MKNKLIASILTLTLIGGAVTPAFASTRKVSKETTNVNVTEVNNASNSNISEKARCGISGSLLGGIHFKKIYWGNGSCGNIIIIGTSDKHNNNSHNNNNNNNNNNSNHNNNNNNVVPPSDGSQTPNVPNNPSVDETPGNTVVPNTPNVEQKPSTPNAPSVEQKPSTPNAPSVEEKPSVNTPQVTPPVVNQTPDNSTNNSTVNENQNFMAAVEQAIFNKVNEERAKAGVPALTYNNTMQKYARIKSQDMGDNNYFSHEDLNGNLITTKMKNDGVSYRAWGENIAYIGGVSDANALANQFMTNWMNSSGHRANILSTNFSSIGVGVYKIGNKVYATQEFYK